MTASTPVFGGAGTMDSFPATSRAPQTPQTSKSSSSEQSERPAKRTKYDFAEDVAVLVGPEENCFSVHKKIICEASDFFRAACGGAWRESTEGMVRLPEADPESFNTYVCWLYTAEIDVVSESKDSEPISIKYDTKMSCRAYDSYLKRVISCFELGTMLQDVTFRNAVVDEFAAISKAIAYLPMPTSAMHLLDVVPVKTTLAQAFVDTVFCRQFPEDYDAPGVRYPAAFTLEIAKAGLRSRGTARVDKYPLEKNRCTYHEHGGEKGKTKCCSES